MSSEFNAAVARINTRRNEAAKPLASIIDIMDTVRPFEKKNINPADVEYTINRIAASIKNRFRNEVLKNTEANQSLFISLSHHTHNRMMIRIIDNEIRCIIIDREFFSFFVGHRIDYAVNRIPFFGELLATQTHLIMESLHSYSLRRIAEEEAKTKAAEEAKRNEMEKVLARKKEVELLKAEVKELGAIKCNPLLSKSVRDAATARLAEIDKTLSEIEREFSGTITITILSVG